MATQDSDVHSTDVHSTTSTAQTSTASDVHSSVVHSAAHEAGSALHHQPAHRSVPGDFNATLATFAAMALYDHLDGEQRARVVVPLDDANRTNWNFLPESGRRGVPIRDMSQTQRYLAHRLIAQCMSVEGYAQVVQVMSLEHVLRELNEPVFGHVAAHFRDPEGYFLTFFNQPQPDSDWGWRLVGHHLSLNFTVAGQDLLASTPLLLGSEPAQIGPFRILGNEEDKGFSLLAALDSRQVHTATIHPTPPPDFASRCVPVLGEQEWPDEHGVGRRDAGITDLDREALRWIKNQRGDWHGGPWEPTSARLLTGSWRPSFFVSSRSRSAGRWTGSAPPARTICTSSGPGRTGSMSRTTSASKVPSP